jgi:hypothetical protein
MNKPLSILLILTIFVFWNIGCSSDDEEPEELLTEKSTPIEISTFQMIQTDVFNATCANGACHAAPTMAGDLDLSSAEVSYANLVGVKPQNSIAANAGMLRIDRNRPENSFLLTKLIQPKQGHGDRMPRDTGKLNPGKIEAIQKWIAVGAPQTGIVEGIPDLSTLPDLPLEPFVPPPPPINGIQLHLPPFEIEAGTEREIFYTMKIPGDEDLFVNKIEIFYPEGSHHFIVYEVLNPARAQEGMRDLNPNEPFLLGIFERRFVIGTQTAETLYQFPEGIAIQFPADGFYDMNAHFVNLSGVETLKGEVYVNLYTLPKARVEKIAKPLFHVNLDLFIPPGETRTTRKTWIADTPINIFLLSSHMHRHGDNFRIFRLDGELLHESFAYNEPPTSLFNPPLFIKPNDGLRYECTHTNDDKNHPIEFGLTSEDEMCIMFGYYYE